MVSRTPRPHFTPRKDPVPILQEARWAPGPVWTDGKSLPHRDSIPDRPARSQSLYRLSYPSQILRMYEAFNQKLSSGDLYPCNYFTCLLHDDIREISFYETARLSFGFFLLSDFVRSYYTLTCILIAVHGLYSACRHNV